MCSKAPSDPDSGLPGVLFVLEAPPGPPLPRLLGLSPTATEATAELSYELRRLSQAWLADLGGSGDDPPAGLSDRPSIGAARRARDFLARAGRELLGDRRPGAVALREPLGCLLLHQWREALGVPVAVLLLAERPEAVAAALGGRDALSIPAGLSLWERYCRSALAFSEGLPVFVAAGGPPRELASPFAAFLEQVLGAEVGTEEAGRLLTPQPRSRQHLPRKMLLPSQESLYEAMAALAGPHEGFPAPALPEESPWVSELLEARSDLAGERRAAEWLAGNLEQLVANRRGHRRQEASSYPLDAGEDVASYRAWLEERGEPLAPRPSPRPRRRAATPYFLVLLTASGASPVLVQGSLDSLLAQDLDEFDAVVLGGPRPHLPAGEGRVHFLEEQQQVDLAGLLDSTTASYVVVLEAGDELAPSALARLRRELASRASCRLAYGDEDLLDEEGRRTSPRFKPGWSPDRLLSGNYLGSPLVVGRELFSALGGPAALASPAGSFEVALRAAELLEEGAVVHLPEILSHRRRSAVPSPAELEAGAGAVRAALERRGEEARLSPEHRYLGGFRLNREPSSHHLVSAVVPFRDEAALLASCYRAFIRAPGRVDFELLLVDNGSVQPETEAVLEELDRDRRVRVLTHPGEFNWSTINNDAAAQALGDVLLFLNNDAEAISPGWLAQLVATGERPSVGAVGARLVYPDGSLQHGGMAVGTGYGALHTQQGLAGREPGYLGGAVLTRECSSVTGACLLSRREVFEKVGGFDENLPTAFGDVDYCLKVRRAGLRVVYDAVAELVHHESKSRGRSGDSPGAGEFRHRWRELLETGDPYYNANLSRFDPYCRLPGRDEEEQWERFLSMLREP